jgi:lysophospholipase L1-like esterase
VSAALGYEPSLETGIAKGFDVRFDLQVCRRLASAGCPYGGRAPSSALDVVESAPRGNDVLVVDVGYNDDPAVYGSEMARVIRTARSVGVKEIVWVNLRETQEHFTRINAVIRAQARRFPVVQVADWNAWSAGKPWFRSDGLHLTDSGAQGLADMLRAYIASAARSAAAATS